VSLVEVPDGPPGATVWPVPHDDRPLVAVAGPAGVVVVDARCPHKGGPLGDGTVRDGTLVCPWHWYAFDLATGECTTAVADRLAVFPVVERDGRRVAEVPPEVRESWADRLRRHAVQGGARSGPAASGLNAP
jgi:nitrite reductase/ring-hydroxylating ferredoxin subunit